MPAVLTVENSNQRENFPLIIPLQQCKKINAMKIAFLRTHG